MTSLVFIFLAALDVYALYLCYRNNLTAVQVPSKTRGAVVISLVLGTFIVISACAVLSFFFIIPELRPTTGTSVGEGQGHTVMYFVSNIFAFFLYLVIGALVVAISLLVYTFVINIALLVYILVLLRKEFRVAIYLEALLVVCASISLVAAILLWFG